MLVYYIVLENRLEPVAAFEPSRYYPTYGYRYTASGNISWALAETTQLHQYTQGSLILDIVDTRTNQAIWRGTATARLTKNMTSEARAQRINEAIHDLLKKFPPPH